ncbi:hypothetical protein O0L34_g15400 [Tuta absoluta]|nr:hypothetical protein O0L34_g15400 [Tuta absoluta]
MILFERLTQKHLISIFIIISLSTFVNIFFMDEMYGCVNDVKKFMREARSEPSGIDLLPIRAKQVLFWNDDENKNYIPEQCNRTCNFETKDDRDNGESANAIIFNDKSLYLSDIPKKRRTNQLYIFLCIEPARSGPNCVHNTSLFNWTITYRLSSTILWTYFLVQDRSTGIFVAPNKSVIWRKSDEPITPLLNKTISKKTKPIVWISLDDKLNNEGRIYMNYLQWHLMTLGMPIDEYNPFSKIKCTNNDCAKMVEQDYFFYIAMEDDMAEDFVSSKVLQAYNNFAVPIVYGGANYSWFLPQGSYLNAKELQPYRLAKKIHRAVSNPDVYAKYFKWRHLYHIGDNAARHPLCLLCEALNKSGENSTNSSFVE